MTTSRFRTPTARVRGHGSAREGVRHFIEQRVSALVLALLVPWFLWSTLFVMQAGYAATADWVSKPWNALLLIFFFAAAAFHMRLGMQTVAEDYMRGAARQALLILNVIGALVLFGIAAFSVLRVALG